MKQYIVEIVNPLDIDAVDDVRDAVMDNPITFNILVKVFDVAGKATDAQIIAQVRRQWGGTLAITDEADFRIIRLGNMPSITMPCGDEEK